MTNTCTTTSTVHSGEPLSLFGLQSNEGEGPQAGIGDLKALPLEVLRSIGVMAPPSLCRWSPLPQPFPQGPVLLEQNCMQLVGRMAGHSGKGAMALLAASSYEEMWTVSKPSYDNLLRATPAKLLNMVPAWLGGEACKHLYRYELI